MTPVLATPALVADALPESVTVAGSGVVGGKAAPVVTATVRGGYRCWPPTPARQRSRPPTARPGPAGRRQGPAPRCWPVHRRWRWPFRCHRPGPDQASTHLPAVAGAAD